MDDTVTITPTEESVVLWVKEKPREGSQVRDVMTRWLEREARRKGRHINEPSVQLRVERDVVALKSYLLAYADSFPDTLPDWLRTTAVTNEMRILHANRNQ